MEARAQAGQKRRTAANSREAGASMGSDGAGTGGADRGQVIEHLRRRFAQFRATHPQRTRIPDPLRKAAVTAVRDGARESEVRRACGVTSDQLAQWRARQEDSNARRAACEVPPPQVFPVIAAETDVGGGDDGQAVSGPDCLELRIGGFAISVRALQSVGGQR